MRLDIIYFGNDWFAENKTSSHHIAQRLAGRANLLYVECPGLRSPNANGRDIRKILQKIFKCLRGPKRLENGSYLYTLLQVPFHRFKIIRLLNERLILFLLRGVCRRLNIRGPVLWHLIPHLYMVPGKLGESLVVYYCIDDYSALPDVDSDTVSAMDKQMTDKADIVFVASEELYRKKNGSGGPFVLSPHGVDLEHFCKASSGLPALPEEMSSIRGPVIGFFGLIEKWIDLELIEHMARSRPEWSIVMIGRAAVDVSVLHRYDNIHLLGRRPYEQLPFYAAGFDAAIMPYRVNRQVWHSNPIKLREYLATGKPVVSVRFPEAEKYSDVIAVADSHEDFVKKTEEAILHDNPAMHERRIERVRDASWESRVQCILARIYEALDRGTGRSRG